MKFTLIEVAAKPYSSIKMGKKISKFPPLGLLYIAGMLENDGHIVQIIDSSMENITPEKLKHVINDADAIGISVYTPYYREANTLAGQIKKNRC